MALDVRGTIQNAGQKALDDLANKAKISGNIPIKRPRFRLP